IGGRFGTDLVASATARAVNTRSPTPTRRSPRRRPCPRMSSMPAEVIQSTCPESFHWPANALRLDRTSGTSSSPSAASREPATLRAERSACPLRSSAFDGMHAQSVLARVVGDTTSDRTGAEDDEVEVGLAGRALDIGALLISGLIQVELSFACCRCRLGHRVDSERFNYRPCRSCWQGDGQRITV